MGDDKSSLDSFREQKAAAEGSLERYLKGGMRLKAGSPGESLVDVTDDEVPILKRIVADYEALIVSIVAKTT